MIKSAALFAGILLLSTGVFAQGASCTAEEAQAKNQEFMNAAMALAQKDAQKYQEVAQAMQNSLPELQKMKDFEGMCKFYDDWIAKMKQ